MLEEELLAVLLAVYAAEEALHLHFARELDDTVYHCLGARGTAGDEDVDGDDVLDALCHMVAVAEGSA